MEVNTSFSFMSLSLKPQNLKRYRDLLLLFHKYGHGDLVKDAPLIDDPLPHAPPQPVPLEARQLARDIEKLGPTYIKLAQLLSTRSDFVPQAYMEALSRLQDGVEPFSFTKVQAIVAAGHIKLVESVIFHLHEHARGRAILDVMEIGRFEVAGTATFEPVRQFVRDYEVAFGRLP